MKFLLALIFFTLLCRCLANKIENVQLFNDFIRIVLNGNDDTKMANLHIIEAIKVLEIVEKCTHQNLHDTNFGNYDIVEQNLENYLTEFKTLSPNNNKLEQEIEAKLIMKGMSDKVQFLMLLYSFATRLAFTIGSEALEKRRDIFGQQMAIDSFPLSYNQLNTAFPMDYQNTYKFRYYQAAIIQISADTSFITLDFGKMESFTSSDEQDRHQKYYFENFKTLLHYLLGKKQRVGKLIKECSKIAALSLSDQNIENIDSTFIFKLIRNWTGKTDIETHFLSVKHLYALKNFAANLLKRIMGSRQKDRETKKFFWRAERLTGNKLNQTLKHTISELNNKMGKYLTMIKFYAVNGEIFVDDDELLLHYEDAFQIDWRTKEDFKIEKLNLQVDKWEMQIENCKFENEKLIDCNINFEQFNKEIDESKILFQNLDIKAEAQLENVKSFINELKKLKEEIEALEGKKNMFNSIMTIFTSDNENEKKIIKVKETKMKIRKLLKNHDVHFTLRSLREKIEKLLEEFKYIKITF